MTRPLPIPFDYLSDLEAEREAVVAFILEQALEGFEVRLVIDGADDWYHVRFLCGYHDEDDSYNLYFTETWRAHFAFAASLSAAIRLAVEGLYTG